MYSHVVRNTSYVKPYATTRRNDVSLASAHTSPDTLGYTSYAIDYVTILKGKSGASCRNSYGSICLCEIEFRRRAVRS